MLILRLLMYVLAACSKKIKRRLDNSKVSKPYLAQLLDPKVDLWFQKFNDIKPISGPLEMLHDARLATIISTREDLGLKYKALEAVAREHRRKVHDTNAKEARQSLQLYNAETYKEFYSLFLEYLRDFKEGIEFLCHARKAPAETNYLVYEMKVSLLCNTVRALQAFVRGSVIRKHLSYNGYILRPIHNPKECESTSEPQETPTEVCDDEDTAVRDVEVEALALAANDHSELLCNSYIKWIKLLLVQVDAVDILLHNIKKFPQGVEVEVQLMIPPSVDKHLIPWETLFSNSLYVDQSKISIMKGLKKGIQLLDLYLPEPTLDPNVSVQAHITKLNANRKASTLEGTVYRLAGWAGNRQSCLDVAKRREALNRIWHLLDIVIQNCHIFDDLPDWKATGLVLFKEFDRDIGHLHPNIDIKEATAVKSMIVVSGLVENLNRTVQIPAAFQRTNDTIPRFKGALHCEISIANHISKLQSDLVSYVHSDLSISSNSHVLR